MQLLGEYGLRCKREIWRAQLALAKVRSAARKLLTLDEKDPKRMFEGDALIRRLVRFGILNEDEKRLDDVLRLTTQRFLERRLQTKVYKLNYAKSIHHARVLILQRHIRVGKQLVNAPSFMVRGDSESHIDFALHSPYNPATGRPVSFTGVAVDAAAVGALLRCDVPPSVTLRRDLFLVMCHDRQLTASSCCGLLRFTPLINSAGTRCSQARQDRRVQGRGVNAPPSLCP